MSRLIRHIDPIADVLTLPCLSISALGEGPVLNAQDTETIRLAEVDMLRRAGWVPAKDYLAAVYRCREGKYWSRWALRALLVLGAGHLLAGIVYFFAYNWDDLSSVARFAILEIGIVVCVVAALVVNMNRQGGQALLIAASVLVGTLLAVIGQVYQTGADAYELFTVWMLLILPWTMASRSAAHWLVWLIISCLALTLYSAQVLIPLELLSPVELGSAMGVTIAAVLMVREAAVFAGANWLAGRWTRLLLVIAGLAIVFPSAIIYVFDWEPEYIGAVTFIALVATMALLYGRVLADFSAVAVCTGFVVLFLMAVGARVLSETIGSEGTMNLLSSLALLVLWCAALTAATVKTLKELRSRMQDGDAGA